MGFLVGVTLTPAVGAFADWLKATIKSKYGTRHLGVRSSLFIGTFWRVLVDLKFLNPYLKPEF